MPRDRIWVSRLRMDGFTLITIGTWPSQLRDLRKISGDAHPQRAPFSFDVRADEREDGTSCLHSTGGGNAVWAGVWECQSQQQEPPQGAEGLLGRMQAKGIVGNYTGLERASNALIQQDIFIKKRLLDSHKESEWERNPCRPSTPQD